MYKFVYLGYSFDYYNYIYKTIQSQYGNMRYCMHPLSSHSRFIKGFYYILSKVKFKPISSFYDRCFINTEIRDELKDTNDIVFIIHYGTVVERGTGFIKELRRDWSNCKIVYHLTDTIEHCVELNPHYDI